MRRGRWYAVRVLVLAAFYLIGPRQLLAQPFAYVASQGADSLIVINTETRQSVATIPVGHEPHAVVVGEDATRVYVSNRGSDTVSVIDTMANRVQATVSVGDYPTDLAAVMTGAGEFVYVTNTFGGSVSVIEAVSNTVVATIPVGGQPWGVASDGDRLLYMSNGALYRITLIDTASNQVVATVSMPGAVVPDGIAVSDGQESAYIAAVNLNSVSVLSTATNDFVATVMVGNSPRTLVGLPSAHRIYSANSFSNSVSVIDSVSNTVVATIPVGTRPFDLALSPDGGQAFVANFGGPLEFGTISVVDTGTNQVEATINVVGNPRGIAVASIPSNPSASRTPTPTVPGPTLTRTDAPVTTGTPEPGAECAGDCNRNESVTIDELVTGVNLALGRFFIARCPAFDTNGSDTVTIGELVKAVNNVLAGCRLIPTSTPTATPTRTNTVIATPTPTPTTACDALAGRILHLNAGNIPGAVDGAAIGSWPDLSGAGNTLSQSVTAHQPLWEATGIGGRPSVRFFSDEGTGGVPDALTRATSVLNGSGARTVMVVATRTNAATGQAYVDLGATSAGIGAAYILSPEYSGRFQGGNILWQTGAPVGAPAITAFVQPSAGAPQSIDLFQNGTIQRRSSVAAVALATAGGTTVGHQTTADFTSTFWAFRGDIAEVIIWNRALTPAERCSCEAALSQRYGIGVSACEVEPPVQVIPDTPTVQRQRQHAGVVDDTAHHDARERASMMNILPVFSSQGTGFSSGISLCPEN